MLRCLFFFFAAMCLLSSCEKAEDALVLPPPTSASHAGVALGADYDRQVFFDFESGMSVFTSDPMSWDLAFEAYPDGRHVFMNGGKNVFVYNTHNQDIKQVTALPTGLNPNGSGWQFDAPCGLPDSTGIGEWRQNNGSTKGDVYIVQTAPGVNQKMRIISCTNTTYTIEWAPLDAVTAPTTADLTKDSVYNFVYFSFTKGIVKPEPPKMTWDIVFTRYRYVYHTPDYPNFPYNVTGVLLNPYQTSAAMTDSTTAFGAFGLEKAASTPLSNHRDAIGFDWKTYNGSTTRYEVNRAKNFVLHTRKDQLYKMHFLDYYNSAGEKGSPSFEYQRLR